MQQSLYDEIVKRSQRMSDEVRQRYIHTYKNVLARSEDSRLNLLASLAIAMPNLCSSLKRLKVNIVGGKLALNTFMIYVAIYGRSPTCHVCNSTGIHMRSDRPGGKIKMCSHKCSHAYAIKCMEKASLSEHGVANVFQSKTFAEHRVRYLQQRYGEDVTGPTLAPGAKEKIQQTSLERHGVTHFARSPKVRAKARRTSRKRFGFDYNVQRPETRIQINETSRQNHDGVHHSAHPRVKQQKIATSMKHYGVPHPMKHRSVKKAQVDAMIAKYGVPHLSVHPEWVERSLKSASRFKKATWRDEEITYQGYELNFLRSIESSKKVKSVSTGRSDVGHVSYKDAVGHNHIYYPDLLVVLKTGEKVVVEVKSTYTLGLQSKEVLVKNLRKFKAAEKHYTELGIQFVLAVPLGKDITKFSVLPNPSKRLRSRIKVLGTLAAQEKEASNIRAHQ